MSNLQVHHALDSLAAGWERAVSLPDPEAAQALNARFEAWHRIEELQRERSFSERGLIILQFERRSLWRHLTDPDTELPFPNMDSWMSCSSFLGCRRTNYEAKRVLKLLDDVEDKGKLIDVPKGTLHVLTQLSTEVRNQPGILDAARTMPREAFEAKVELEHPLQHIESRSMMRFSPGRSGAKVIEQWVSYAIEHDLAGSRDEAIVRACEAALNDAQLDEELRQMPREEEANAEKCE